MFYSEPYDVMFRGQVAKLYVVRNNGYCWGRIEVGGEQYDVVDDHDWYDYPDDDAAAAFKTAMEDENNIDESLLLGD